MHHTRERQYADQVQERPGILREANPLDIAQRVEITERGLRDDHGCLRLGLEGVIHSSTIETGCILLKGRNTEYARAVFRIAIDWLPQIIFDRLSRNS